MINPRVARYSVTSGSAANLPLPRNKSARRESVHRTKRSNLRNRVDDLVCHAIAQDDAQATDDQKQQGPPPNAPPERKVPVDIKTVQLDGGDKLFQCFSTAHLRYEAEYGLNRGTTTNCYLLAGDNASVLVDVPRKEYLEVFCNEIKKEVGTVSAVLITHLNPDVGKTLAATVPLLKTPDGAPLTIYLSNPAKEVLISKIDSEGFEALKDDSKVKFEIVGKDTELKLGRRNLNAFTASTPRYPEMVCLYERNTRRLYSSCMFSAHANPQHGSQGTDGMDRGGWQEYGSDWRFFFDCMFAPVATQANKALDKLDVSVTSRSGAAPQLLLKLKRMLGQETAKTSEQRRGSRPVGMIMPRHGPVVRQGVAQLIGEYDKWVEQQLKNLKEAKVAVLYASAYGNTATLAQAISRGITKAGVGVEMVNLEQASLEEAEKAMADAQGFCIGAPTLGGHMPTQVSAMLGSIVRLDNKNRPCGVYGSFGWSGEAVDKLNTSLADAGFPMAFKPIKVQFRPTAKNIQVCEESGTDLAQTILKSKKKASKQSAQRATSSVKSDVSGGAQAMGRVVGSLSVITAKHEEAESAMLASWISQASFDPPGLTVAVKRDRATESLMVNGNSFNVNILKQGSEGPVMKALLKTFEPGEDRFGGVEHHRSESNDCVVLEEAVSVLECTVAQRIDAGDHYIVYGTIGSGKVLDDQGLSAVHHRKAGNTY